MLNSSTVGKTRGFEEWKTSRQVSKKRYVTHFEERALDLDMPESSAHNTSVAKEADIQPKSMGQLDEGWTKKG